MAYKYVSDLLTRLERREKILLRRIEKMKKLCVDGKIGGEADRQWMTNQIKHLSYGVDICSGDFLMSDYDNVVGVDGDFNVLGAEYTFMQGDELTRWNRQECEFVVTNYIEAFPNPLKALNEWNRVLKQDGLLVFCCSDADAYADDLGAFCNKHRQSVFNQKTIRAYLTKTGFKDITIEPGEGKGMRVKAIKI